jgi:integrase
MKSRVAVEWYAVFYRGGKRATAKLGSYPTMPVADARATFQTDYAPAISAGAAPESAAMRRRHRSSSTDGTLRELCEAYIESLNLNARKRTSEQVRRIFFGAKGRRARADGGIAKSIGLDRPASEITPRDIVPHLSTIHARGARVQANTVRAYLSAAFNYGRKAEHDFTRSTAGATWGLKSNPVEAIPPDQGASKPGDRFLDPAEFREFWLWLIEDEKRSRLSAGLRLKMATGQRTEEVLSIDKTVYQRADKLLYWERTKNSLPHSLPLPHQVIEMIEDLPQNSYGLYFPHARRPEEPALCSSFVHVIYRFLDETKMPMFTARDLRRTWKTLAGAAGISKEMRDRLQNHTRGDVSSRHYDRYSYWIEKQSAMEKWAAFMDLIIAGKIDHIGAQAGNVVKIGKAVAAA